MGNAQREEERRRRQAERRRSHLNDPPPKQWNLRNIWVFGQHLPLDWGVIICTVLLALVGSVRVGSQSGLPMAQQPQDCHAAHSRLLCHAAAGVAAA